MFLVRKEKTPFRNLRKEFIYFQGPGWWVLYCIVPFTVMRHFVLTNLLDEERGAGWRRPVTGVVDCDDGDRVFSKLGGIYDGSISTRGFLPNAIQVYLISDRRLSRLVVKGLRPRYIQF